MIEPEELNKAGIDYNAGLARFMGDPSFYELVLDAFARADIPQRARAAYDSNDRETLLSVVHEAKGSSGNAGLNLLYAEARALVKLLRSQDYTDAELSESYLRFESTYLSTQSAIKASIG